jgi:hypothetical protein
VLLFAVYFNQTDIVKHLLTTNDYKDKIDALAIKRPPSNNQEYHIIYKEEPSKSDNLAIELAVKNKN